MISDVLVDRFVAQAVVQGDEESRHSFYMRFICVCLRALVDMLPEVAEHAFARAGTYWLDGEGSLRELDEAREECWKYLDSLGAGTRLDSAQVIGTRAVICALYPKPQSPDFDEETLRWFVMLVNKLGDFSGVFAEALSATSG
jgi:hypothetical protein